MMGSWTHRLRTSTLDPTFFAFYISFVSLLYLFMILSTPCLVKLFHAPSFSACFEFCLLESKFHKQGLPWRRVV